MRIIVKLLLLLFVFNYQPLDAQHLWTDTKKEACNQLLARQAFTPLIGILRELLTTDDKDLVLEWIREHMTDGHVPLMYLYLRNKGDSKKWAALDVHEWEIIGTYVLIATLRAQQDYATCEMLSLKPERTFATFMRDVQQYRYSYDLMKIFKQKYLYWFGAGLLGRTCLISFAQAKNKALAWFAEKQAQPFRLPLPLWSLYAYKGFATSTEAIVFTSVDSEQIDRFNKKNYRDYWEGERTSVLERLCALFNNYTSWQEFLFNGLSVAEIAAYEKYCSNDPDQDEPPVRDNAPSVAGGQQVELSVPADVRVPQQAQVQRAPLASSTSNTISLMQSLQLKQHAITSGVSSWVRGLLSPLSKRELELAEASAIADVLGASADDDLE